MSSSAGVDRDVSLEARPIQQRYRVTHLVGDQVLVFYRRGDTGKEGELLCSKSAGAPGISLDFATHRKRYEPI
jgi:hypothetical protein